MFIKELTPNSYVVTSLEEFKSDNPSYAAQINISPAVLAQYNIYIVDDNPTIAHAANEIVEIGNIYKDPVDSIWKTAVSKRPATMEEMTEIMLARNIAVNNEADMRLKSYITGIPSDMILNNTLNIMDIVSVIAEGIMLSSSNSSDLTITRIRDIMGWVISIKNDAYRNLYDMSVDIYNDINWTTAPLEPITSYLMPTSEFPLSVSSESDFTVDCLNGTIIATSGTSLLLDNGSTCLIRTSLPSIAISGSLLVATLPLNMKIIKMEGYVTETVTGNTISIGDNGVSCHLDTMGNVNIVSNNVAISGGYIKILYI